MRISICDDNDNELQDVFMLTEKYMQEKERLSSEASGTLMKFQSAASLLAHEETNGYSDIYILDIIMPDTDGIALGHILHEKSPKASILYLTSSKDFAIEAFSVKAFSYLLKPITETSLYHELDLLFQTLRPLETQIKIRDKNGIRLVTPNEVIAIEYFYHHLIYHTAKGCIEGLQQRESFDHSVSDFMESGCFLKISASHIVNMNHIKYANGNVLFMVNGAVYKITRRFSDAKKKYLDFIIEG